MINKNRFNFDHRLNELSERVLSFNGIIPQNIVESEPLKKPTDFESYLYQNNPDYDAMRKANYATEPLFLFQNPHLRQDQYINSRQKDLLQLNQYQINPGYEAINQHHIQQQKYPYNYHPVVMQQQQNQYPTFQMSPQPQRHNNPRQLVQNLNAEAMKKLAEQEKALNLLSHRSLHSSQGRPITRAGEMIAKQKTQEQEYPYNYQQDMQNKIFQEEQMRKLSEMHEQQMLFQQQILAQQQAEQAFKLQRQREKEIEQKQAEMIEPLLKNQQDILTKLVEKIGETHKKSKKTKSSISPVEVALQSFMNESINRAKDQQQMQLQQERWMQEQQLRNQQSEQEALNMAQAMFPNMQMNPFNNQMLPQNNGFPFQNNSMLPQQFPGMLPPQQMPGMLQMPGNQGLDKSAPPGIADIHQMMFKNEKDPRSKVISSILQDLKR